MKKCVVLVFIFLSLSLNAFQQFDGVTFDQSGPNCFGSALKIAGHYKTFRGVDTPEFEAFLELACERTQNPSTGDIGVFAPKNYAATHAFVYIDQNLVIDKPGVDYIGQTPVSIRRHSQMDHIFLASMECRRYSGHDISLCANEKKYFKCDSKKLKKAPRSYSAHFQSLEQEIGRLLNQDVSQVKKESLLKKINHLENQLDREIQRVQMSEKEINFLRFQIESLLKQTQFFRSNI